MLKLPRVLKLDGKVNKIWPLFFHRIWKYDDPLLSFLTATHQQQLCLNWDYFLSIWSNLHIQSISVMLEYYQKKLFYLCTYMSGLARIPVMKGPYFLFKNGSTFHFSRIYYHNFFLFFPEWFVGCDRLFRPFSQNC